MAFYLKVLLFYSLSWKLKTKKMKDEGPKVTFIDF